MSDRAWQSPKELAAHLNVSLRSVRRWIAEDHRDIEIIRVAGIVRVRLAPHVTSCHLDRDANTAHTH